MPYTLLPFRFFQFTPDEYLLTNEVGEFIFLSNAVFSLLIHTQLPVASEEFQNLKSKYFVTDTDLNDAINMLSLKYRTKKAHLSQQGCLQMVVPTIRCNSACIYCQVNSRQLTDSSVELTRRALEKAEATQATLNAFYVVAGDQAMGDGPMISQLPLSSGTS